MTAPTRKPQTVLVFSPGLEALLLPAPQMTALCEVADVLDPQPLGAFTDDRAGVLLPEAEILFAGWGCPPIDAAALALAPNLKLVAYAAGTVKDFVTPELWEHGVRVTSAVAANAIPVAEFTLAAILLANKSAFWSNHRYHAEGAMAAYTGPDVGNYGKRIGIIGASHVGRLVIEMLRPFDLSVLVYDPYLDDEAAAALGATAASLTELMERSDIVSLHAPLLPETRGMIGAAELAAMRDGATFINTARGPIVDASALEAELVSGRINAVIDTSDPEPLPDDSPLRGLHNVFLTLHIAGSMGTEIPRMADYAIAEIGRWARGEPLEYEVYRDALGRLA